MKPYIQSFNRPKSTRTKGFALLFAVLASSLLLAVGLAIFSIALKESFLASVAKESQTALYAADVGAECALYWDFSNNAFDPENAPMNISCVDNNPVVPQVGGGGYLGGVRMYTFNLTGQYCVRVDVTKYQSPIRTVIDAHGFNTCDTTSRRRVERAFKITY